MDLLTFLLLRDEIRRASMSKEERQEMEAERKRIWKIFFILLLVLLALVILTLIIGILLY